MSRRSRGFTLYEMVLVLGVTAGLGFLLARPAAVSRASLAERAFWPAWQRLWRTARQLAISQHHETVLVVVPEARRVELWAPQPWRCRQTIPIPRSLQWLDGPTKTDFRFNAQGWGQARTVHWRSTATGHHWQQAVQLGGSLVNVYETT